MAAGCGGSGAFCTSSAPADSPSVSVLRRGVIRGDEPVSRATKSSGPTERRMAEASSFVAFFPYREAEHFRRKALHVMGLGAMAPRARERCA
jgi:hypothetical protein